jgi:A/G-specific adenine glycosylase
MCVAKAQGTPQAYPVKTRKLKRSAESHWLLCAVNSQGDVWLSQRPTPGVWAGLYCFEMFGSMAHLESALAQASGLAQDLEVRDPIKHVLTHKDLHLHPVLARVNKPLGATGRWIPVQQALGLGLPAPIKILLQNL